MRHSRSSRYTSSKEKVPRHRTSQSGSHSTRHSVHLGCENNATGEQGAIAVGQFVKTGQDLDYPGYKLQHLHRQRRGLADLFCELSVDCQAGWTIKGRQNAKLNFSCSAVKAVNGLFGSHHKARVLPLDCDILPNPGA